MGEPLAFPQAPVPEHSLAAVHGLAALAVGAFAWSGAAAAFGPWSLVGAPWLGWMVAWSCRHGGRRASAGVRVIAWLLSLASVLVSLLALAAFSVFLGSPDAGLDRGAVAEACWSLFASPPWFGSLAVLLAMPGTARALREGPSAGAATLDGEDGISTLDPGAARAA